MDEHIIRTTLYVNKDLMKRFHVACSKKFGDKQGKIIQGFDLAITDFCDKVLDNQPDQVESPDLLAKKLPQDSMEKEVKTSVNGENQTHDEVNVEVDQEGTISFNEKLSSEDIVAKAKKLAEERKKEEQDSNEHQILT